MFYNKLKVAKVHVKIWNEKFMKKIDIFDFNPFVGPLIDQK